MIWLYLISGVFLSRGKAPRIGDGDFVLPRWLRSATHGGLVYVFAALLPCIFSNELIVLDLMEYTRRLCTVSCCLCFA
jgi:hypothetical protein